MNTGRLHYPQRFSHQPYNAVLAMNLSSMSKLTSGIFFPGTALLPGFTHHSCCCPFSRFPASPTMLPLCTDTFIFFMRVREIAGAASLLQPVWLDHIYCSMNTRPEGIAQRGHVAGLRRKLSCTRRV